MVFMACLGALKSNYVAQNRFLHGAVCVLYYLSIFLLILPFAAAVGVTMMEDSKTKTDDDALLYYVDSEGFGANSDVGCIYSLKFFISWKQFEKIDETRDGFRLKVKKRPSYWLWKRNLTPEKVSAIRQILAQAPIEKKALREG